MTNLIAFCLVAGIAYSNGEQCADIDVLPPCQHEDGVNCYWNAQTMGNGIGTSFVDVDGLLFTWSGSTATP